MRLRNRVREVREALGLSQYQLARKAVLSRTTLRAIELDDGYPASAQAQRRICEALNRTDLFWIEREDTDPPPPADEGV